MKSLTSCLTDALRSYQLAPFSPENLARRDFLPTADFDRECPGLSKLRKAHAAIIDELEAAQTAYADADAALSGVDDARLAALQAGEDHLPSKSEAASALADAALRLDLAQRAAAPALAEFAVAVRDAVAEWNLSERRTRVAEKQAEAQRLLAEVNTEAEAVHALDNWRTRLLSDGQCLADDWRRFASIVDGFDVQRQAEAAMTEREQEGRTRQDTTGSLVIGKS